MLLVPKVLMATCVDRVVPHVCCSFHRGKPPMILHRLKYRVYSQLELLIVVVVMDALGREFVPIGVS